MQSTTREERTGFQEIAPYHPEIDLKTDFVMVYGLKEFRSRAREWAQAGYDVRLMVGVAWGDYEDYLNGQFDGTDHWDEAQTRHNGSHMEHCTPESPYMVPTESFAAYLSEKLKATIDDGVTAIYLEEPEYWTGAGYSKAFQREWSAFYGTKWVPPHQSLSAFFHASRLKQELFRRCITLVAHSLKEYSRQRYHRELSVYVAMHSLLNYTQWGIIAPDALLCQSDDVDGFIAQVWTGTARCENTCEGRREIRVLEPAIMEYGMMGEMARASGKAMWFLHDPVEDSGQMDWKFYQESYVQTVTASLLHPEVYRYEIAPWPNRVFRGQYRNEGSGKTSIPAGYATQLMTVFEALKHMKTESARWETSNLTVGVLVSDSAMFQRFYPADGQDTIYSFSDGRDGYRMQDMREWNAFYGLTLPLLKQGIFVKPIILELGTVNKDFLYPYRILVLGYDYMKPMGPAVHQQLAEWVRQGGVLVYAGDDSDPYHAVADWWNEQGKNQSTPYHHLLACLGIADAGRPGQAVCTPVGKGFFLTVRMHPTEFTRSPEQADVLRTAVGQAAALAGLTSSAQLPVRDAFVLRRGNYLIAAGVSQTAARSVRRIKGRFVNLLDADLALVPGCQLTVAGCGLFYDMEAHLREHGAQEPSVLAASLRVEAFHLSRDTIELTAAGPANIRGVIRLYTPEALCCGGTSDGRSVTVENDPQSHTALLRLESDPRGVSLILKRIGGRQHVEYRDALPMRQLV